MMIGRNIRALLVVLFVLLLPALWLFRSVDALPARFAPGDCRTVGLTDSVTGKPAGFVGDMSLLSDGDTVVLAARGGLYTVALSDLAAGNRFASPVPVDPAPPGGLAPLALAVSSDGSELAFLNRDADGGVSILGGHYQDAALSLQHTRREREFCRAHDLDFSGEGEMGVLATLEGTSCGFSISELAPSSRTGQVVSMDLANDGAPAPVLYHLAGPTGIAGLFVAESRLERIDDQMGAPIPVPGRPDRLNWGGRGGLIAALHPSLPLDMAFRYGVAGSAPSRIVRIDLDRTPEVLFDDPGGKLFSSATAAVLSDGILLAGSDRQGPVLVCRKPAA